MCLRLRTENPLMPENAARMSLDRVSMYLLPRSERATSSIPMSQYMRIISAEAFCAAFDRAEEMILTT